MRTQTAADLVRAIADRCDGAATRDAVGFDGRDAHSYRSGGFLAALATKPIERWSPRMHELAAGVCRKYRRQADECGLDVDTIVALHAGRANGAKRSSPAPAKAQRPLVGTVEIRGRRSFAIGFSYDPLTIDALRAVGARYTPTLTSREMSTWTLWTRDVAAVAKLRGLAGRQGWEIREDAVALFARLLDASAPDPAPPTPTRPRSRNVDVAIDQYEERLGGGHRLRPFQRACPRLLASQHSILLGDEMGTGKTIQALASLEVLPGAYPAIIVAPPSLLLNWAAECAVWLPWRTVQVIRKSSDKLTGADVTIVGYTMLKAEVGARRGSVQPKKDTLCAALAATRPASVVADESHYAKNPKSQRTRGLLALAQVRSIRYRLLMSGTPILNRPAELAPQLAILGRLGELGGKWAFLRRYCGAHKGDYGWDLSGATNAAELHRKLADGIMLRRLKVDVLKELPPKVRGTTVLPLANRATYVRAEANFLAWLRQTRGNAAAERAGRAEMLTRTNALRLLAGAGKIKGAIEWIRGFADAGRKLVLFIHHHEVRDGLLAEFPDAVVVTGGQSKGKRDAEVRRFQDGDALLAIVSTDAGGVGLTLHANGACQDVAFLQFSWTPGAMAQAEDRIHRIGQTAERVNVHRLVSLDTIDDDMAALLAEKQRVLDAVLDGNHSEAAKKSVLFAAVARMEARSR